MNATDHVTLAFERFRATAVRFCELVDSSVTMGRSQLLLSVYVILPQLIHDLINLPAAKLPDEEGTREARQTRLTPQQWHSLYERLKAQLGGWDLYRQVFDPTRDTEAIHGSLADDIADIYRDLKDYVGRPTFDGAVINGVIWASRFGYYSHWGQHALDALRTIHCLMSNEPEFQSLQ
jgi:hypothetical protein